MQGRENQKKGRQEEKIREQVERKSDSEDRQAGRI